MINVLGILVSLLSFVTSQAVYLEKIRMIVMLANS